MEDWKKQWQTGSESRKLQAELNTIEEIIRDLVAVRGIKNSEDQKRLEELQAKEKDLRSKINKL